ncbi:hypothetical protein D3C72_1126640 [compost metagenome]
MLQLALRNVLHVDVHPHHLLAILAPFGAVAHFHPVRLRRAVFALERDHGARQRLLQVGARQRVARLAQHLAHGLAPDLLHPHAERLLVGDVVEDVALVVVDKGQQRGQVVRDRAQPALAARQLLAALAHIAHQADERAGHVADFIALRAAGQALEGVGIVGAGLHHLMQPR